MNLEAEACGTRVITYDVGGCKETVRLPESIVITENVEEIVKKL